MKISLFILFIFMSTMCFADTSIVFDGKKLECHKLAKDEYKCKQNGETILVKNTGFTFTGISTASSDFPKVLLASEVIEDNNIIFKKAGGIGTLNNFFDDLNLDSISNRVYTAQGIIENWSNSSDPDAKDIVSKMSSYVALKNKNKDNLTFVGNKDQKYDCSRSQSKTKENICNVFVCTNNKNEKALGIIPSIGSFEGAYAFIPDKDSPQAENNGVKILDPNSSDPIPLFHFPKIESQIFEPSSIEEKLFSATAPMPKRFRGNQESYKFFTDQILSANFETETSKCNLNDEAKNLIKNRKTLQENLKDEISQIELSQFLTILNGKIISLMIDADKSASMGCLYNGMILSKSMVDHLKFLEKSTPKPPARYLSVSEVQELFKKAKAMKDIPFGYKYDGCYARAHVMAKRFEAMGIPVEKAWIKGNLSVPNTDIEWNYHVAPAINVKDENGKIVKYVIDPSLNDKAVPLDTWVDTMSKNVKGGVVKTPYPFPVNIATFQRTAVAVSSSDVYIPDNDEKRTESQNMALAIQTMKEYSEVLRAEGHK